VYWAFELNSPIHPLEVGGLSTSCMHQCDYVKALGLKLAFEAHYHFHCTSASISIIIRFYWARAEFSQTSRV